MLVSQILKDKGDLVFTASPHETVGAAAALLHSRRVGAMIVLDEDGAIAGPMAREGRFSGGTRGLCIGHVGPEAAAGGPIALVQDGDIISIDATKGTIDLEVSPEELARRKADWTPRTTNYNSGAIWKFAQLVGPAYLGATTHPGAAAETHVYADI